MSRARASSAGTRGAIFIDVVTSMAFVLLLIALAQTWARAVLYGQKSLEAVSVAHQETAIALEAVARDLRDAGFDTGAAVQPIAAAGSDRIEIHADLNGDGDLGDAHERVRYAYRADRRQVTRASGDGGRQPFVDDVPPDGLRFTFWDANGREIASGPDGVGAADLARIRRIDASLRIELPHPDPRMTIPIRAEASTTVALRNP